MSCEEIQQHLMAALTEIQVESGRSAPTVTNATVPDRDLPGFDSNNWVEVAVILSERVGQEIDALEWVAPDDGHHRTVGEIAHLLCPLLTPGQALSA